LNKECAKQGKHRTSRDVPPLKEHTHLIIGEGGGLLAAVEMSLKNNNGKFNQIKGHELIKTN
jgi:hypothetical protein